MKLFELEADITLNSEGFATDLSNAVSDAQTLATEIDNLNTAPVGVTSTKLTNVVNEASSIKVDIDGAKQSAIDTEDKMYQLGVKAGNVINGLLEIFAGVAGSLVETVIAGIFELGAEGIEMAAKKDSPLAKAYNNAIENLGMTREMIKLEVGEALLPWATGVQSSIDRMLSALFDFDKADKILYFFDTLQTYSADNLKTVAANVDSVFSAFEKVTQEDVPTLGSMTEGVESQTQFWEDYNDTLQSLMDKGVDTSILSDIADGSVESLAQLQALDAAAPEALASFMESMSELESAEIAAAETINAAQVDAYIGSEGLKETFLSLLDGINQEEAAKLAAEGTTGGIIAALAEAYPQVDSWVDAIRNKFSELGMMNYTPREGLFNPFDKGAPKVGPSTTPHASGLSYVPYDGYKAELHRGEEVLTRQQAEERRTGSNVQPIEPGMLETALFGALTRWGQPMGASGFGAILTPQIDQNLANNTRGVR